MKNSNPLHPDALDHLSRELAKPGATHRLANLKEAERQLSRPAPRHVPEHDFSYLAIAGVE